MSIEITNNVSGAIKVKGVTDAINNVEDYKEFLNLLPDYLDVEVPSGFSGVIVNSTAPSEDDKNKLWIKLDGSGNYSGSYLYTNGGWKPLYNLPPGQIIWMYGASNSIPEGFKLIETDDGVVPNSVAEILRGQYISNGAGGYSYFAVRYVGY